MKVLISEELRRFLALIRFMTRIPVPSWVGYREDELAYSTRYLPLIGVVVGGFAALTTLLMSAVFPLPLAIALGMAATILLTGAFHEDGWCDVCDGFGGMDQDAILRITKDSRLGSYGVIGIITLLGIKFLALIHIVPPHTGALQIIAVFVGTHALSRAMIAFTKSRLNYLRTDGSKMNPAMEQVNRWDAIVVIGFGALAFAPLIIWKPQGAMAGLILAFIGVGLLIRYCRLRLGGYTGDYLGATQQVAECALLVGLCIR